GLTNGCARRDWLRRKLKTACATSAATRSKLERRPEENWPSDRKNRPAPWSEPTRHSRGAHRAILVEKWRPAVNVGSCATRPLECIASSYHDGIPACSELAYNQKSFS